MKAKYSAAGELWLDREASSEIQRTSAAEKEVTEIFLLLRDPIYHYLWGFLGNPAEAEDLAQEVFLRLYTSLEKGLVVGNIRAWMFRVAHNLAVNQQKRKNIEPFDAAAWDRALENVDPSPSAEQTILDNEQWNRWRTGLARLSPQERHCLELRAEGLRYREIAEVLGVRISTVVTFLSRATKKLMKQANVNV